MKKRPRLPSPALAIALIALFLALGGSALAASRAGLVRIADSKKASRVARVDPSGRLEIGDGNGPLTVDGNVKVDNGSAPLTVAGNVKVDNGTGPLAVDGTVDTQPAAPSAYLHTATFSITQARGCVQVAQPPTSQAMVVGDVRIDVFNVSTTGPDQDIALYGDSTCTTQVGDVNPATVGETTLPFDPGLAIPAGSGMSARALGTVEAEVYTDAFAVPASAVPAAAHHTVHHTVQEPRQ